jgi:acyl-CoA thioester hydrolase
MSEADGTHVADYRFWVDERVRFNDLDLLGHVNNVAYVVYVENGRAAFLRDIGLWTIGAPRQIVIVHFAMDYRREVRFPAELRVGVRALAIGNRSFRIGVGIFRDGQCVATADNTVVCWDTAQRRAVPLDERERAALAPHLPAAVLTP